MRKKGIIASIENSRRTRPRYLVTNQVLKFHTAILSDPVLIHRFKGVNQSVILTIANQMLDLLRLSWDEGLEELIEPFFQQRVMQKVKEAEVDSLFTHFLKECDLEGYNTAGDYWICMDKLNENPGNHHGGFTTQEFYEEVMNNKLLKNRFVNSLAASVLNMSRHIMEVVSCKEPGSEYFDLLEQHRNMKITNEEFDEFLLLFFRMCAPINSHYLSDVWDNVLKIKKAMIPDKF